MTIENSSWYCASPEEPLRSVHVAYIYGSHAEDRVNERQREEDDSYCGKDKDGGFVAVLDLCWIRCGGCCVRKIGVSRL